VVDYSEVQTLTAYCQYVLSVPHLTTRTVRVSL